LLPSRDADVVSDAIAPVRNNCDTERLEAKLLSVAAVWLAGAPEKIDVIGSRWCRVVSSSFSCGS
jgi:hypothetical protein